MRTRKMLLGLAATTGLLVVGCSSDDTSPTAAVDSGSDQMTQDQVSQPEAAAEAAAEGSTDASANEARSDAMCVPDADLAKAMFPDAAIADSGATLPGCIECVKTTCASEFAACATDCDCVVAIQQYLSCAISGSDPVFCGAALAAGPSVVGNALGLCVAGAAFGADSGAGCLLQCGINPLNLGGAMDGGSNDAASDAGADRSAGDAGVDASTNDGDTDTGASTPDGSTDAPTGDAPTDAAGGG